MKPLEIVVFVKYTGGNMKTIDRAKSTLMSIGKSIRRFPATIIISTILAIMLIYLNVTSLEGATRDMLIKIDLIIGLGIFLSLIIGLILEKYKNSIGVTIVSYGAGALVLAAYYFFFLNDLNSFNNILTARYAATIIAMFLGILFIQRINKDSGYEYYVMDIFSEIALTTIYSIVLYLGFAVILFTINTLFEAELSGELYLYAFIIVVFIFAVSLFLSKFPSEDEEYVYKYTNALRVLLTYIVIPLISIYTLILYVYFGKILITREWPQGLVSHLVLWYSALSVGVLFLTNPIIDRDKISSLFKKIFPKAILPLLLMMFLSIGKRVSQYGITENRYFVILLGVWVLMMMLYYGFKRNNKNTILPISLSIVLLLSVYGPISSFSISKSSQNNRLEDILEENDMILDGDIVSSSDISSEEKKEVNNIITYFENNHKIDDIKILPDDFKTKDMVDLMGFKYESYNRDGYNEDEYVFYGIDRWDKPIDIEGYEYYIELNTWATQSIQVSDFKLKYDRETNILDLILDDGEKLKYDIGKYAREVYDTQSQIDVGIDAKEQDMDIKDMTFDMNVDDEHRYVNLKLIFTNINGQIDSEDTLNLENCEFIILVNISDKSQ